MSLCTLILVFVLGTPQAAKPRYVVGPEMESVVRELFDPGEDERGKEIRLESATLKESSISIVFSHSSDTPFWVELRHRSMKAKDDTLSGPFAWQIEPSTIAPEIRQWLIRRLEAASTKFVWTELEPTQKEPVVGSEPSTGALSERDGETLQKLRTIFDEASVAKADASDWQFRLGKVLSIGDLHPRVLYFAAVQLRALEISQGEEAYLFLYKRALAQIEPYLRINSDAAMRSELERIRVASLLALGRSREGLKWLDYYVAKNDLDGGDPCAIQTLLHQGMGQGDGKLWQDWTHQFLERHPECTGFVQVRVWDQRARADGSESITVTHPLRILEQGLSLYYAERFDESIRTLSALSEEPLAKVYLALGHYRAGRPLEAERWVEGFSPGTGLPMELYVSALILRNNAPEKAVALLDKLFQSTEGFDWSPRFRIHALRLRKALSMELERGAQGLEIRAIGDPEADRFGEPLGSVALAPSSLPLVVARPRSRPTESSPALESLSIERSVESRDQQALDVPAGGSGTLAVKPAISLAWAWWLMGGIISVWGYFAWRFGRRRLHTNVDRQTQD